MITTDAFNLMFLILGHFTPSGTKKIITTTTTTTIIIIIMDDFSSIETMHVFKDFIRVPKNQMTLLGALISRGHAMDKVLQEKPMI